jgi:RimJ/RimL family protein N-acetyltransferase
MLRVLTEADRQLLLDFAHERERENLLLIGHFDHGRPFDDALCVGSFRRGKLLGAAAFFRLWGSFVAQSLDLPALRSLVDYFVERKCPIESILGFRHYVVPILERLRSHGIVPAHVEHSVVMELRKEDFRPVPSAARQGRREEAERLVPLDRVLHGADPAQPVTERERLRTLPDRVFLLEQDGTIVSKAVIAAFSRHYAEVGGVVTHTDHRRRGYALQCLSALCVHVFGLGLENVLLFTAEQNLPAQELYKRLGFRETERFILATF